MSFENFCLNKHCNNGLRHHILESISKINYSCFDSRLSEFGESVGSKLIDIVFMRREKNYKREIKLLDLLIFIKSTFWKVCFNSFISERELIHVFILDYYFQGVKYVHAHGWIFPVLPR